MASRPLFGTTHNISVLGTAYTSNMSARSGSYSRLGSRRDPYQDAANTSNANTNATTVSPACLLPASSSRCCRCIPAQRANTRDMTPSIRLVRCNTLRQFIWRSSSWVCLIYLRSRTWRWIPHRSYIHTSEVVAKCDYSGRRSQRMRLSWGQLLFEDAVPITWVYREPRM